MENILSINLESSTSPIIQEVRGRDYIEYGTDEWRNLYPQFLIDLYYNSSTHAAIINATSDMIAGTDIIALEDDNLEAYVGLKKFLANANGNETLHEVIKKIAFDFKLQGGYALNIIWSQDRQSIAAIHHIPVERVRAGKPNELGKVDTYFVSADWSNTRANKPQPVPAFNVNDRSTPSQILYTGSYSPNMDVYHTPDYNCMNWALIDQQISIFHLNNINNSFSGSYVFSFNNGIPSREERQQVEKSLTEKFTSASNAGRFLLSFSDSRDNSPEVTPLNTANLDKQYIALQELILQNVLTGHRCTSPMLVGINSENGFGSNEQELNSAFEIYLNTVVKPFQNNILKTLSKILTVNGINLPLEFVQSKPITTMFTVEDMKAVMTTEEIRKEMGLPELTEEVVEEENKETLSSEKTELESWIEEFGEDMPEDWEMVDEEIVDGEHNDFDFEKVLNEEANEKLELASTVKATPNKRSEQDGVNKSYNDYYKVRYVYATDNFLTNKSGTSRSFCKQMVAANKLYTKEDLVNANSQRVNKGFGHNGRSYNIFLYKGGPQCRHFFLRRIYKTSLRAAKSKISSSQLISYTKAKSEGFTAERNDKLVAIAPQRMRNNGYYN
jgi:hypothetical protein